MRKFWWYSVYELSATREKVRRAERVLWKQIKPLIKAKEGCRFTAELLEGQVAKSWVGYHGNLYALFDEFM